MTEPKYKPIPFTASMVRAILNDCKTQTRRVFKTRNGGVWPNPNDLPGMKQIMRECPYGQPGDRLWVKENFCPIYPQDPHYNNGLPIEYDYKATYVHGFRLGDDLGFKKQWISARFMPRRANRITLKITGVRVERLQDITEDDCLAEGIGQVIRESMPSLQQCGEYDSIDLDLVEQYGNLWDSIHGPSAWKNNPWVWVVEFNVIDITRKR